MKEHYSEAISLESLSKSAYLSPVYLSKIFKEETGDSPINYLINMRLNKAKELLEEGDLSIKTIAKSVGYNDAYYFSKLFKKHFGVSPLKLKQKQVW
jgi:YesN/AraC family two-component response regulator